MIDLWHQTKFCDCTITAEGREFEGHRNILAAASEFFDGAFSNGFAETGSARITLPELSERMGWFWNATRGGRGGCVHAQHVWGGHAIFDVTSHAHAYMHRRGASPRLAAFR